MYRNGRSVLFEFSHRDIKGWEMRNLIARKHPESKSGQIENIMTFVC